MRARLPSLLAIGVIGVTALVVIARVPAISHDLSAKRKQNDAYSSLGRTFAAADSLDIDNAFVDAALELLPEHSTYAVLSPPTSLVISGTIASVTQTSVSPFMRYLLLPRRQVPLRSAEYVLCYVCGERVGGVRWVWTAPGGLKIGRRAGA